MDEEVYGFGRETANRILREIAPEINDVAPGLAVFKRGGSSLYIGKTSGTITARSGATLGSGTVVYQSISSGALADTSRSETIYNLFPESVGNGRYVFMAQEKDSKLLMLVIDPGMFLTSLRINGNDLQYYKNGAWVTWHTGESCTV